MAIFLKFPFNFETNIAQELNGRYERANKIVQTLNLVLLEANK